MTSVTPTPATAAGHIDAASIRRIAAFCAGDAGGNPAGVWIGAALPPDATMQRLAYEVGYSETAFAAPQGDGYRVRYFSPAQEVPFCGHATIALGAVLAEEKGEGVYPLTLNQAAITVEGSRAGTQFAAALQSPPTHSRPADPAFAAAGLALFGWRRDDLDPRIPPGVAHAGNDHLVIALASRELLGAMRYDQEAGRALMAQHVLATIVLVFAESAQRFHTRNPFAIGGVYEDPATGSGTAALAGYLRDLGWPHGGVFDVVQGEDMGMPSHLRAEFSDVPGSSIRVRGTARRL